MGRSKRLNVAIIAAALSVVLVGCTMPPPSPLSDAERAELRSQIVDGQWLPVARDYPEAVRPDIRNTAVVPDRDWPADIRTCMRDAGFLVTVDSSTGVVSYESSAGKTPLEYAVRRYSCGAQYVTVSDVTGRLTTKQYLSLMAYYLNAVRPCLLAAGAPSPAPPGRSAFVAGDAQGRTWNPFEELWSRHTSRYALGYLETRCPPVPSWLDLADAR